MSSDAGRSRWFASLLALPLLVSPARGDDEENWRRLRSAPRDRRLSWSEKLGEFDRLPSADQALIRSLDQKVAALPEPDRSNYLSAMRRYHLWLQSLSEAQRNEVNSAPPRNRMALVSKMVAEQSSASTTTPLFVRLADSGGVSLFDLATRVKVWAATSPAQRAELNRLDEAARQRRIRELAAQLNVAPVTPPRGDEDAIYDRVTKKAAFAALRRSDDSIKQFPKFKQKLVEHVYFVENPPARVKPDDLMRFVRDLPVWVRSTFDPLPPDEARRRMTILYRLVYPPPNEFRPSTPVTSPAAPSAPAAPATPRAPTTPTPY